MLYKNKHIKSIYSFAFTFLITGMVLFFIGGTLIIYGLIRTNQVMDQKMAYDQVLELEGNHAVHVAYFEFTEVPVKVGQDGDEGFYLLTDGKKYVIAGMKKSQYEKVLGEFMKTASYTLYGSTNYIPDKDIRKEIAENLSIELGQDINVDNMDQVVGDVQIRYTEMTYRAILKENFSPNMIVGGILAVVGAIMFMGNFSEIINFRKVQSISGISAKDIDKSACKEGAIWYPNIRVYVTPDMLVGLISDVGHMHFGQVALRYNEIVRIYGYNEKSKDSNEIVKNINYKIIVEAIDGNRYELCDEGNMSYKKEYVIGEMNSMFAECQKKSPSIIYGPENTSCRTYTFPLLVYANLDGSGYKEYRGRMAYDIIPQEYMDDYIEDFETSNLAYYYSTCQAIVNMTMEFTEEGEIEIQVYYFEDMEEIMDEDMEGFLLGQLMDGWGEGKSFGDFIISVEKNTI
ncbi:MAG: hypothetical protein K6E10_07620 [Eubacterium sp.]|nr:hypothetical protein [Eubacterium sp.]